MYKVKNYFNYLLKSICFVLVSIFLINFAYSASVPFGSLDSSSCLSEFGHISSSACGNGVLEPGEQCDDSTSLETVYSSLLGSFMGVKGCQPTLARLLDEEIYNEEDLTDDEKQAIIEKECKCDSKVYCADSSGLISSVYESLGEAPMEYIPEKPNNNTDKIEDLHCTYYKYSPPVCCQSDSASTPTYNTEQVCLTHDIPICGNGVIEGNESCDFGFNMYQENDSDNRYKYAAEYWIEVGCASPIIPYEYNQRSVQVPINCPSISPDSCGILSHDNYLAQFGADEKCDYRENTTSLRRQISLTQDEPLCSYYANPYYEIPLPLEAQDFLTEEGRIYFTEFGNQKPCTYLYEENVSYENDKLCTTAGCIDINPRNYHSLAGFFPDRFSQGSDSGIGCSLNFENSSFSVTVVDLQVFDYFGNAIYSQTIGDRFSPGQSYNQNFTIPEYLISNQTGAIKCLFNLDVSSPCGLSGDESNYVSAVSNWFGDFDVDGFWGYERTLGMNITDETGKVIFIPPKEYDCDDYVYDDANIDKYGFSETCQQGFGKFLEARFKGISKDQFCYNDTNNDGIGDFAKCSYCRNPGMTEVADDIDNNCGGTCQGNVSRKCLIEGENSYLGDGAVDTSGELSCSGVVNSWRVQDSFCQMVDDNVKTTSGEVCGGYDRAVKGGYMELTDQKVENTNTFLLFQPGGILGIPLPISLNDLRFGNALIGTVYFTQKDGDGDGKVSKGNSKDPFSIKFKTDGNSLTTKLLVSFLGEKEGEDQITRGTNFGVVGTQFIDSFRGEFNKPVKDGGGKTYFDLFWEKNNLEIRSTTSKFNELNNEWDTKFNFNWITACVSKDKCADEVDNDGPKDIRRVAPFDYLFKNINSLQTGTSLADISNFNLLSINFFDMDDPTCKNNVNPYNNTNYCIDKDGDGYCNNSIVFPDCYDQALPIRSQTREDLIISNYADVPPESIHPFAEVNDTSCTERASSLFGGGAMGLDRNCNKNGFSGLDDTLLAYGGTPYDNNLFTGMEYVKIMESKANLWTIFGGPSSINVQESVSSDQFCAHRPIGEDFDKAMYIFMTPMRITIETFAFGGVGKAYGAAVEAGKVGRAVQMAAGVAMGGLTVLGGLSVYTTTQDIASKIGSGDFSEDDLINAIGAAEVAVGFFSGARGFISTQKQVKSATSSTLAIYEKGGKTGIEIITEIPKGTTINVPSKTAKEAGEFAVAKTPGCFLENTSVTLANGSLINIEDLKVGASVVAFDLENNKAVIANITATMIRDETNYRVIEYG